MPHFWNLLLGFCILLIIHLKIKFSKMAISSEQRLSEKHYNSFDEVILFLLFLWNQ